MADETSMLPWEVPDSGGPGLDSEQLLGACYLSHSSMFDIKSVQLRAVGKMSKPKAGIKEASLHKTRLIPSGWMLCKGS